MSDIELKLFKAIRCTLDRNGLETPAHIRSQDVEEIAKACLAVLVTEKLVHTEESIDLHKAEQQIHGFKSGKSGWSWAELLNGMALKKEEWIIIKRDFSIGYLSAKDIDEINDYFK